MELNDNFRATALQANPQRLADRNERVPELPLRLSAEGDALIAHLYGLTEQEFTHILTTFPLVPQEMKDAAIGEFRNI